MILKSRLKKIICFFFILVLVLSACINAAAYDETEQDKQDINDIYNEQLEFSGANKLFYDINQNTSELLLDNGINSLEPEKIMNYGFFDFIQNIWDILISKITAPFTLLTSIVGVVLLCALINALKSTDRDNALSPAFTVGSTLAVCGIAIAPILKCILDAADAIRDAGNFMLCFIPVFTSIVTTSGKPLTAAAYHTTLFSLIQIIIRIGGTILVPLTGIYLAIAVTGSIGGGINSSGIASVVKKTLLWGLGLLLTVFIGVFIAQTFVSSAADTVSTRTAKFLVSGSIPVVGGAISEGVNAIGGCLRLLKSTTGVFGVLAVVFTMLPAIIIAILNKTALSIGAAVSEMFSQPKIAAMLKSAGDTFSILLGMLVFSGVLMVAATSIVVSLGTGY
ncbi:MAG: stage III sporulation protein AE [Oscillospiraceae bacterium]|nr:stage III sporulation protein AE [Oscillospiraceae bacterium]